MAFIERTLISCIWMLTLPLFSLHAQDDEEYRMELGGGLGGSFYMGDANYTTPFKNIGVAGGFMARFIMNPRMSIKTNLMAGRISGNTKNFKNKYPDNGEVGFKRTLFDLGAQFEYNFLAYGTGIGYNGGHRFTPYILGGMGFTFAPAPAEGVFTVNFPIGVGVKYKIAHRINIGCEFTMRFSLSDKLDVTNKEGLQLNDPYRIKSQGWKNKDSYSYTVFFVTYDLFPDVKNVTTKKMSYTEQIDFSRIPQHVAIIMDGNGRWAKQRGRERSFGHQTGAETVHVIAEEAARMGIKYLTLYTFSTENWNRPSDEVAALMSLLFDSIEEETFMKNNISFRIIGDIEKLPENVLTRLNTCVEHTSHNTGMCLVLALSYSSRWEITEAAKQIAIRVQKGEITPEEITCDCIESHLTTHFMPNPDLLIRTGGEIRLSNYLLWQCAYSELYFCDTFWPDFREEELRKAICDYQKRERRFGKTSEQIS